MVDRHIAWIGLGSNLDDPAGRIRRGVAEIAAAPGIELLAVSPLYRTAPVGGPAEQPMFCNAAAVLATELTPHALLDALQAIEAAHDRVRDVRWGPRTLDLDILAYDERRLDDRDLCIPHPRAHERGFVLAPLADIAPALRLGAHGRVIDCLARVARDDIQLWETSP
ncbi:2-amino-4-hydroxy-6-hydroxymethyldihydropteridine diphosphokinase [Salinisphaera sp.]|uniref:2-amino-4-hydroxy-6- hydroxymethyldihydropteridine diphosphokinase n=1 Tax=Salinisphaera sp. TaxID=1914330 RepID=UPI002D7850BC|nr:2-amino-4-hydroxy-6-hydroxymethyldihydropteridine diphosphokinase [Salinisphaera sp.]HET7315667.1 2-amino-4-hydroxy-6-hydroxymethyldihydropteridine diphosphokinase [Salinisphaera sp.]